ncbi:hypothetical protein MNBD_GAMMA09-1259 [hydrothermal vent metagenome]|uniref:Cytochrome c domain-containing protein n=1 Tax=hydrothermal vent metagenome TaxID=652676 RepID=A0A3B0XBH5_9ZZZZ
MKKLTKQIYAVIATAGMLVVSSSAFSAAGEWPPTGDAAKGAKTWSDNCNRCHNLRDPKQLRDDQWISTMFHMRVRAGLTGEDTRDILAFLQASNNTTSKKASVRASTSTASAEATAGLTGEGVYTQTCIACHGGDGKGTVPGAPDFTDKSGRLSKADDVLMNHMTNGFQSSGSPMAMPAKGGNSALTQGDLKNVLQYLKDTFLK